MPRTFSRGDRAVSGIGTHGLDVEREARLVKALAESALGGSVKALAGAFVVSDSAIYHQADGVNRSCWHDTITWLDAAIRGKGQTAEGRRAALAPLLLLVELYLQDDDAQPDRVRANAAVGDLLARAGRVAVEISEAMRDNNLSPEERERIYAALVPLAAAVPAVGAVLGFHLPPVGEVAS